MTAKQLRHILEQGLVREIYANAHGMKTRNSIQLYGDSSFLVELDGLLFRVDVTECQDSSNIRYSHEN